MIVLEKCYTYEMILQELEEFAAAHRGLAEYHIIGQSHDGRDIPMVSMGYGRNVLFCTAGIHGNESVNPTILLKMMEEYARAYEDGVLLDGQYEVRQLLQRYSILFIPLVNPDGYEIARRGFGAIMNPRLRQAQRIRRLASESWRYNARGVDINRNFPCQSYVRQPYGDYPASENETKALLQVFQQHPSVGYLDFHSRGKIIYYYRQAMPECYNRRSYLLARRLQGVSQYSLGRKENECADWGSGGNSVQYYSEHVGAPAITVETVEEDAQFPLDISYQKTSFREIRYLPMEIMAQL